MTDSHDGWLRPTIQEQQQAVNDATTRFLAGDPNYAAAKVRIVQTGDEQWFIEDVENAKLLDGVYPGAFRNKKMATEWAVKRGWMVIP